MTAIAKRPSPPVPTESDWNTLPLAQAERLLAEAQDSVQSGSRIIANRIARERTRVIERCIVCRKPIPQRVEHGQTIYHPIFMFTSRNPRTGIEERHSICTQKCYMTAVRQNLIRPPGGMTPHIAAPPERTVKAEPDDGGQKVVVSPPTEESV